jgi:phosphoglycolate phosphatase
LDKCLLVLFDIDGTMLLTRGVGVSAFLEAAQSLFKVELTFEGVEVHGRTDPLIWQALAKRNGIEDHEPYADQLREGYHRILKHLRCAPGGPTRKRAVACHQLQ